MSEKTLTYTRKGSSATFTTTAQIDCVQELLKEIEMWRTTANTYRLAIEIISSFFSKQEK